MDKFLEGKQAVVTGGTRGIGRAIAHSLLEAGAEVAICGRTEEATAKAVGELATKPGGKVTGTACDVRDDSQVAAFFRFIQDRFGGHDILINNAGLGIFKPVGEMNYDDWRTVIDTNLTGVFLCCQQALPQFQKRGGGFIINISSLAGKNPFAGGAAYNASKFGLNGFSEAMMLDHRYDNVKVSYVMPGSVDTDFRPGSEGSWKIAGEDIAEIVISILSMAPRTLISRVEVRPSKPKRR